MKNIKTRTNSKHITRLIGPTLIALTISEAKNRHIWAVNIALVTYQSGTFCLLLAFQSSVLIIVGQVTGP